MYGFRMYLDGYYKVKYLDHIKEDLTQEGFKTLEELKNNSIKVYTDILFNGDVFVFPFDDKKVFLEKEVFMIINKEDSFDKDVVPEIKEINLSIDEFLIKRMENLYKEMWHLSEYNFINDLDYCDFSDLILEETSYRYTRKMPSDEEYEEVANKLFQLSDKDLKQKLKDFDYSHRWDSFYG